MDRVVAWLAGDYRTPAFFIDRLVIFFEIEKLSSMRERLNISQKAASKKSPPQKIVGLVGSLPSR